MYQEAGLSLDHLSILKLLGIFLLAGVGFQSQISLLKIQKNEALFTVSPQS